MRIISFILFITIYSSCQSQIKSNEQIPLTVLSAKLKVNSQFRLNYLSKIPPTHVSIQNNYQKDSNVSFKINIEEPTEFFYVYNPPVAYSLILLPGDSIHFDENKKVTYGTNLADFTDNYIEIPEYGQWFASAAIKSNPFRKGFKNLLNEVSGKYIKNDLRIQNAAISMKAREVLKLKNLQQKYFEIYNLIEVNKLNKADLSILDSIGLAAINGDDLFSINSPNLITIMNGIARVSALKNGANLNNPWEYFTKVDDHIQTFPYYKKWMYEKLIATFFYDFHGKQDISILQINKLLLSNKDKSPLKDSLITLSKILLETITDYSKAKTDLNSFEKGKFSYVFENDALANHETKNIRKLNEKIEDINGKEYDLSEVLIDKKYKLIVIDFWASWCIPCIKEFPALEKAQNEMKNLPVKLIGISTDDLDQKTEWIEKTKLEFKNDNANQFRLLNDQSSGLKHLLQITSIPRYILMDNNGTILDEDLERPSSIGFKKNILDKIKKQSVK